MAMMAWSDEFSVGVKAMDEQHKGLIQVVNDLHLAMTEGRAKEQTGPLLKSLLRYTQEHFAAEEALMNRTKFAGLAGHAAKHRDLTVQVQNYVSRYQRGEIALDVHLLLFLCDWLKTHIQKDDKTYGPWLNSAGVR